MVYQPVGLMRSPSRSRWRRINAGFENGEMTLQSGLTSVRISQPGKSVAQRRLMAIRAARMAAMRELAEQIHGLKVNGNTTVVDLMVNNDTFRGVVSGVIRGARTVRINPTGEDTYEIVLEIDRSTISQLMQSATQSS